MPRNPKIENLSQVVTLKCTPKTERAIKKAAAESGRHVSHWLRIVINEALEKIAHTTTDIKPAMTPPKVPKEMLASLRKGAA